jgi:Zn-dependent oligopeptidase
MLNQLPKLSKKERKRLLEEFKEIQRKKSYESKNNDQSVSSWDYVYYMMKYKSKD